MRLLNFLSGIAPVLVCLAAPNEGDGNPAPVAASPPEPTGATLEEKFTSAKTIIADFFRQLGGAMREKDEAIGQVSGLTARAEKAEKDNAANIEIISGLNKTIENQNTQITGLTTERNTARSRVTLIESFCKHSNIDLAGLDKFQAAKTVPEVQGSKNGKAIYDEWQALKNSGQGKKATAFSRKHKAELDEYAESLR